MKMMELLSNATIKLESLSKTPEIEYEPEDAKSNQAYLNAIALLSQRKLAQLKVLFEKLLQNRKSRIDKNDVQPLIDFIKTYTDQVENTPLNFNHRHWHINRVLREVCKSLAEYKFVDQHALNLMFPKLHLTEELKQYKLGELHQVVISDDNKTFIDVAKCLNQAALDLEASRHSRNYQFVLYHTHPVSGMKTELSASEKWRVKRHTKEAKAFYDAIEAKKSREECEAAAKAYKASLDRAELFLGYAEEGQKKIYAELHKGITDRESLIAVLQTYDKSDRDEFLKTFTPEQLYLLVLGDAKGFNRENFRTKMTDASSYNWTLGSNHDECASHLFLFTYEVYTSLRPTQTESFFGRVTKDEKLNAIAALKTQLIGDAKFSRIGRFRNNKTFEANSVALTDGLLKEIYIQMEKVSKPEIYRPKPQQQPSRGWFGF